MGSKSLGTVAGRFFEGGWSLLGCVPVRIVPAGGSWTGLYQLKLGVARFTGDFVIFTDRQGETGQLTLELIRAADAFFIFLSEFRDGHLLRRVDVIVRL
jgi:hypothetical protein